MVASFRVMLAVALVAATPSMSSAASTAASTGIAAGLGLTAASGKTTVSSGGGGIEAALLASDAVRAAGKAIHDRAQQAAKDHKRIFVLGHADTVDLASARWMYDRIGVLGSEVKRAQDPIACKAKPAVTGPSRVEMSASAIPTPGPADITAALATDVTINPVTITEDDRILVTAVARPGLSWASLEPAAQTAVAPAGDRAAAVRFIVPGEIADVADGSPLYGAYQGLLADAGKLTGQGCTSDGAKGALSDVNDFVKAVGTSASKGQPPIMVAAELFSLDKDSPLILRVAIEQVGGTAIVRSNIWYELGWPDAATVSAGILASFRLIDPRSGELKASGLVRCIEKPVGFDGVRAALDDPGRDGWKTCRIAAN